MYAYVGSDALSLIEEGEIWLRHRANARPIPMTARMVVDLPEFRSLMR